MLEAKGYKNDYIIFVIKHCTHKVKIEKKVKQQFGNTSSFYSGLLDNIRGLTQHSFHVQELRRNVANFIKHKLMT